MAYTRRNRRYSPKRRNYKRNYRKKSYIPRKRLTAKVYPYKRHVDLGFITTTGLSTEAGYFNFQMSDLPSYSEFTALYDQYKLKMVKIYFVPFTMDNSSTAGAVTDATQWQCLYTAIDSNGVSTPTSINQLRQYQTCRFTRMGKVHKRVIYPKPATELYNGVAPSAYATAPSAWINTSYSGVPHYGLKWAFDNATSDINSKFFRVEAVYYMVFRQVL